MEVKVKDSHVFGRRIRSVVWQQFRGHDENCVLTLLGLILLQESHVLRRLPFNLQRSKRTFFSRNTLQTTSCLDYRQKKPKSITPAQSGEKKSRMALAFGSNV